MQIIKRIDPVGLFSDRRKKVQFRRKVKSHFHPYDHVRIEKRVASTGELLSAQEGGNAITRNGMGLWMLSSLAGQAEVGQFWSHCAVGTGDVEATPEDVSLVNEIERIPFTAIDVSSVNAEVPYYEVFTLFGPEEANGTLTETAILNNVLDVMLARFVYAPEVVTEEHTFSVRYRIITELNIEVLESSPESSP